jgi:hypothetical protein
VNELTTISEDNALVGPDYYKPSALMDPVRFQHLSVVARVMADSSFMPASLRGSNPQEAYANAFMVTNISDRWGTDPFLTAQAASVVHNRLMFEGKLVASVLEALIRVKLVHSYGKWDSVNEACILGEAGQGDALAIRIGEGYYNDDGTAIFRGRFVDGCVGVWKTTGNGSPWKAGNMRKLLVYRGTREWARIHQPGVMLGVLTDDEYDPAYSARDITPNSTAGAGQSVIERLRANKEQAKDGFDADRVNQDLNTAAPPRGSEESPSGDGGSTVEVEETPKASTSESSAPEADQVEEGAVVEVGESSAPSSPDEKQWLLNVAGMLWAATNYNGDADVLKAQKVAAAASYDPTGISQLFRDKATSIFKHCMSVVQGEVEPGDGLSIVAGIVGVEDKVLLQKSGRA